MSENKQYWEMAKAGVEKTVIVKSEPQKAAFEKMGFKAKPLTTAEYKKLVK